MNFTMSTYPAAEGLQLDDRFVSEQQEKMLASPTGGSTGTLEKNDKVPMEFGGDGGGSGGERMEAACEREKRYCGLSPKRFWVVLAILLVAVVGGAVGGGVGGSLAGKSAVKDRYVSL